VRGINRVVAIIVAATFTLLATILAGATPALAMNPCLGDNPPETCDVTGPLPAAPLAPTSLVATSILQTSVALQWTDAANNETGYTVYRVDGSSGASVTFNLPANSASYLDTAATPSHYYDYYVSAQRCNLNGCSSSSAQRVGAQLHQQPATPTGGLSSSSSLGQWGYYSISGWTIDFDTTAPIQVSLVLDGAVSSTITANGNYAGLNSTYPGYGDNHGYGFYTVKSTVKGTHSVCVKAINVAGGNDLNLVCSSYQVFGKPSAATNLSLSNTGTSMVVAFTDNANDETGYTLQRSTDAQASWLAVAQYAPVSGSGGRASAVDYSTPPAGTCYRILMTNSYGNTPSSPVCS
jgi:hypothetical protein